MLFLLSCYPTQEEKVEYVLLDKPLAFAESELQNTNLGLYQSLPNRYGGCVIFIKPHNKYEFSRSGCLGGSIDSGSYININGVIQFKSDIGEPGTSLKNSSASDLQPPSHYDEVASIESFYLNNHKLKSSMDTGLILFKKALEHFVADSIIEDKFYGKRIDGTCRIIEEGAFVKKRLNDGLRYKYMSDYNDKAMVLKVSDFRIVDSFPNNYIY